MKQKCEGLFTKGDCLYAINNMKVSNSPGLIAQALSFISGTSWPLIGDIMLDAHSKVAFIMLSSSTTEASHNGRMRQFELCVQSVPQPVAHMSIAACMPSEW